MYRQGDRLISKINSPHRLTKGKAYLVTKVGNELTRIMADDGREMRFKHASVDRYFDKLSAEHLPPESRSDDFAREMGYRRLENPGCTCGAWAIKDHGHSGYCDMNAPKVAV
jgi:hypothetical protein